MNLPDLVAVAEDDRARGELNDYLGTLSAEGRVDWAMANLPHQQVLSSSFGAQSAVSLHLLTQRQPGIPVLLIDTGYLFPETYQFIDTLSERLQLNLRTYRPAMTSAWQEARYGRLWEQGVDGIDRYNRLTKVEPMQRALAELEVRTWYAGLRRGQSNSRRGIDFVELRDGRWKVHPLADWSDRDVWHYLTRHDLPYHPLWHEGYVSIGDVPTTRRLADGMREEETRFFGLKRECGIHGLDG